MDLYHNYHLLCARMIDWETLHAGAANRKLAVEGRRV